MATHVKKGDMVIVISGDDKGKTGEVLRVDVEGNKVLVQGVNRVYRHMKPSRRYPKGGRIQKEMPINISNVLTVDPKTNKPTRVGFRVSEDGSKVRFAKKSGEVLGIVKKPKQVQ
ncbi:MAG: 50S ribosomal protein L24 [Planctomycetaceae bacterium]|nr:MAG: 50S ribosomal protein L24 [Planctomycetaceae bacterium]